VADNPFLVFRGLYGNDWPKLVREVLGMEPDADQIEILTAVQNGERQISWRSGHGVGKSQGLAWCCVCHSLTRYPQATVATAPTSAQLFDALAVRVKEAFKKLPPTLRDLFEVKSESITLISDPEGSFVTFRTSRAETPEALAGVHAENVLLIADEASGVPEAVFTAAAGSMSGTATMILAGNPVRTAGRFYDTHNRLASKWHTIHTSCVGHPRVTPDFLAEQEDLYGLDTNDYRVRVLGEFPRAEADAVIPYELIQLAIERDVTATAVRPIWGLDCARFGSDRSALVKRQGNVVLGAAMSWKGLETMELTGRIKAEWDKTLVLDRPEVICVDSIGLGAGVADRLAELGLPARAIAVSEAPSLGGNYLNLKAELWYLGRQWFVERMCRLGKENSQLAAELGWPHQKYTSSGKLKVEGKEELKKRMKKSPDLADAFILTFAASAVSALYGTVGSTSWKEPMKREIKCLV
jgi:hypothetical protein